MDIVVNLITLGVYAAISIAVCKLYKRMSNFVSTPDKIIVGSWVTGTACRRHGDGSLTFAPRRAPLITGAVVFGAISLIGVTAAFSNSAQSAHVAYVPIFVLATIVCLQKLTNGQQIRFLPEAQIVEIERGQSKRQIPFQKVAHIAVFEHNRKWWKKGDYFSFIRFTVSLQDGDHIELGQFFGLRMHAGAVCLGEWLSRLPVRSSRFGQFEFSQMGD